jgi:hypothetical protein
MSVYTNVFSVAQVYLGPATEKFLARQCKYLKVEPADLTREHLKQLAWFAKNGAAAIMDLAQAEKLAGKIESL